MSMEQWLNKIHTGDCFTILKDMPKDSVNCVMFSPPYWGLRDYKIPTVHGPFAVGGIGTEEHPQFFIDRLTILGDLINLVLKKSGSLWLNIGDTYFGSGVHNVENGKKSRARSLNAKNDFVEPKEKHWSKIKDKRWLQSKQLMGIPWRVAIALQNNGWILRNSVIWHKSNHMPCSARDRLTSSYEFIFHFVKSQKYYYNLDAVRRKHKWASRDSRSLRRRVEGKNGKITKGIYATNAVGYHPSGANPGDCWTITTKAHKGIHFAVYPEKLCEIPIKATCPENGVVLDPFCGSGTTCLVAAKLCRNYIGIELNPDYVKIAEKRLAHYKTRLDGFLEVPSVLACKTVKGESG